MSAIREQATCQKTIVAFNEAISGVGTFDGAMIDTDDYACGVYFSFFLADWTTGDFQLIIEHSDTLVSGDFTVVDKENLIFNRSTGTLPTLNAASSNGDNIVREGVVGTKRYVRANVAASSSPSGTAIIVAVLSGEYLSIYANGETAP